MGAHRTNPMALAASAGDIASVVRNATEFRYDYSFEVTTEPNKAKAAEIRDFIDAELAAGKEPKDINVHFDLKPEDQDLVVYHRVRQFREIKITEQVAAANIRFEEAFRKPLVEVMNRAQMAFDGGPGEAQA